MSRKITIEIAIGLILLLWLYAASIKLIEFDIFVKQLRMSPLLRQIPQYTAVVVLTTEVILVVLLTPFMPDQWRRIGLYGSAILLLIFTTYLICLLSFADYVPCACGGIIGKHRSWKAHIIFNLIFELFAIIGIIQISKRKAHRKNALVSG